MVKRTLLVMLPVAGVALGASAQAVELEEVWRVDGLEGPESAVYDPASDALYVTNVAGEAAAKDDRGFVSKLSLDGEILEKEWVGGMQAPKGVALVDGRLYIADIDQVVVVDIESAEIAETVDAPDSQFLNDVTAGPDGRVFISDMMTNTIWVLEDGNLQPWVQSDELANPNGVLAEDDRLVVGSWGVMNEDFTTDVPGHLLVVDYETRTIEPMGATEPIGNLDGVEPDGSGGYILTDWMNGGIFHATADGSATELRDMPQGSADHTIVHDQNLMILPMMLDGEVIAYRLSE